MRLDGRISASVDTVSGVLQGSVLGPDSEILSYCTPPSLSRLL